MNLIIIIYSVFSLLLFFLLGKVSYKFSLVDLPKERKIHSKTTAYTGGIIISIILLCAIQFFYFSDRNLNFIIYVAFFIAIVGFVDDKYNLNARNKLSLQVIPILYLVIFEKLVLNQIGDYDYFKFQLGIFSIPFTFLCILLLINSFNYFDGLDGTLSFATISSLAILFFLIPEKDYRLFIIMVFIPLSVFLLFNFSILNLPKLFLGDGGSLLLGFIISFLLIYASKQNYAHPILIGWSVVIFVYEFLSINIIRLKSDKDLFKPGQDHLHHIFFNNTRSIFFTNFLISILNILLFLIGFLSFLFISPLASFLLFIFLFIIFFIFRNKYFKKNINIKI